MNTFNMKQWLQENKAGVYSKINEIDLGANQAAADAKFNAAGDGNVDNIDEGRGSLAHISKIEAILDNLLRNVSTDSTIPTRTKEGLLRAFRELQGHIDELGFELEVDGEDMAEDVGYVMKTKLSDPNRCEPLEM